MRGRVLQYSFNGGEISRRMEGRSDLDGIYDRAVAAMRNFVATVEGPAMKRPGFRFIGAAASSSTWLTPFVFNSTQSYVLEWLEQKVRFFTNGGRIDVGPAPFEVAVPYTAAQAPRVSSWQSFDRLYLAHPSHPPAMLQRNAAESFAFNWLSLKGGPFKDWNTDKTITVAWAGGTGLVDSIVTVQSTKAIFKPGHVGGAFIVETHDYRSIKAWEPNVRLEAIALGEKRRSDGKVYSLVDKVPATGSSPKLHTGTIQPTHYEGEEWDGSANELAGDGTTNNFAGALWRYEYDRFGAGVITEVLSATQAKMRVTRRLPDTTATYKWAHGCFSNAEGWPHLVTVWGQRLIFFKGTEIVGSVVGDYFNFSPITPGGLYSPDMAFRRQLGLPDPPLWCHPDKEYLLAGCSRGEVVIGQINRAAGLSSDNLRADPQSGYGSAAVWPVAVGTGILFVQRGGHKIREGLFNYQQERFVGPNVNIYARHITRSGVNWLAFQQEPEEMLWGGRGDGALIAHPHSPEQAVKGFSLVQLGQGAALSGCSIPSPDGTRDELWILAELDGQKGVLQLADWWDEDAGLSQADACFVDWSVSYSGAPKQNFTTGLDHLEGKSVRILADGAIVADKVVTGGAIALPTPASKVHIGLGYAARIRFLRPEVRGVPASQGLRKRLKRILLRLINSGPLQLVDRKGDPDPLFGRANSLPMGTPAPLFEGDTPHKATGDGSDYDVAAEIVSDDALPCIVSMSIATYELEDSSQ